MKTLKIYNTLIARVSSESNEYDDSVEMYASELAEAMKNEDVDLAEYADDFHGDSYYKKLKSVKMGLEFYNGLLYGLATCTVSDDWNDTDTEQLKEYLTGQYSDGWGEGFEQSEITSFTADEEEEIYDDETDEYYYETYDAKYYVFVSFWQDKGFKIMTEAELKAA